MDIAHVSQDRLRRRMIATFFWPGLTVADDLAVIAQRSQLSAIEVLAGWERDRTLLMAKGLAGTALSLLLAFVGAALDTQSVSGWFSALAICVTATLIAWAGVLLFRVQALAGEFAAISSRDPGNADVG